MTSRFKIGSARQPKAENLVRGNVKCVDGGFIMVLPMQSIRR